MRTAILISCLLFSLFLIGCRRSVQQTDGATDMSMLLSLKPETPIVGRTQLLITLKDDQGKPVDGATLEVRGDMSHAGMQPMLAKTAESKEGVYEVPFEWSMAGYWVVTVTAMLPDGRTVIREFDLTVSSKTDQ